MDLIHIGIGTHVVALYPHDGSEVWRTKLRSGGMGTGFVALALQGGKLYAGLHGEVYCLDPSTGTLLWHNRMKGLGMGFVSFVGGSSGPAARAQADAAAASAAAVAVAS